MERCPKCDKPYGKRKRCYYCTGKQRTGELRSCKTCGVGFYVQANQMVRGEGVYCSLPCKHKAWEGRVQPWARPDETIYHSAGYALVWKPDHPKAVNGRVFEHRLVMEQVLGRFLKDDEYVHHLDENKINNAPENLQVVSNPEHGRIHAKERQQCQPRRIEIQCEECGGKFEVPLYKVSSTDPRVKAKYCSMNCRHKSWARQMVIKRREKRGS